MVSNHVLIRGAPDIHAVARVLERALGMTFEPCGRASLVSDTAPLEAVICEHNYTSDEDMPLVDFPIDIRILAYDYALRARTARAAFDALKNEGYAVMLTEELEIIIERHEPDRPAAQRT